MDKNTYRVHKVDNDHENKTDRDIKRQTDRQTDRERHRQTTDWELNIKQ